MAQNAFPSGHPDLCEACMDKESKSTSASEVPLACTYCAECRKKLCKQCSRYHRKNDLTRNHHVVSVADVKYKEQIVARSNCMKHKRKFDLYCSDCKKLICISCFAESHQNHRLQDVRSTVEGCKNEIKDSLSSLKVCESEVLERKVNLNCELEKYRENLESLKLEVLAKADTTIKLVGEHANLVTQDIDQFKVQKHNEVQAEIEDTDRYLTCLESFKVYCAEVMTKGSASDICRAVKELKARGEKIKKLLESETELKTRFRKISFLMSDLEEFVKTEDYNIIGSIRECQTEAEEKDETETTSDNISHDGNIKMEDDCSLPILGSNGILTKINHLNQELENERRRIRGLEMEKKTTEKRINELKLELGIKRPMKSSLSGCQVAQASQRSAKQVPLARTSIDYKRYPNLVKTRPSLEDNRSRNGKNIFGLTVMDDELFLGCFNGCSVIEVYDTETLKFKRRWQVKSQSNTGVDCISCLVSCTRDKCLYACLLSLGGFVRCHVIQRTDVNGSGAKEWKIKGSTFVSNISVTGEGNVIVINNNNSIIEYSRDGIVVHEVKLSWSLYIEHPLHALKLANGSFVVSQGLGDDRLHRVHILSESGQITKSFGELPVSGVCLPKVKQVTQVHQQKVLNEPVCLTVDASGNILVADGGNNRILVLNSNLELDSSISQPQPVQKPSFMCFDADKSQLFVCEDLRNISVLCGFCD